MRIVTYYKKKNKGVTKVIELKNSKTIAIVTDCDRGVKFSKFIKLNFGVDVELFKIDFEYNDQMINMLIGELNKDPNVSLITIIKNYADYLVCRDKRFVYKPLEDIESEIKYNAKALIEKLKNKL